MNGRYLNHRRICERIIIEGRLILETPTHLGNGDSEGVADMPLLRDPLTTLPLLTGASIAGALRSALREYERGYGIDESRKIPLLTEQLFGHISEEQEDREASVLSWLMVEDAVACEDIGIELRDGVTIDRKTRTAEKGKKYDVELLPAGTRFDLSFELLVPEEGSQQVKETLAIALGMLQAGEIGLGQRKRRGFGRCRVETWSVRCYDLGTLAGLIAWLEDDHSLAGKGPDIAPLLLGSAIDRNTRPDRRSQAVLEATFDLDGSLLVRSASGKPNAPDAVHLRNYNNEPVLPGTSLAGALRSRAELILNLLGQVETEKMINSLFGPRMKDSKENNEEVPEPRGSRLWIQECVIESPQELVQSRVMIDRFTGGALPQHLFSEQPLTAGSMTARIKLINPTEAEVGLLLLLLKDLWTGDLALGGESSVGRGRLKGKKAFLEFDRLRWVFKTIEGKLEITGDQEKLEKYVRQIPAWKEA